MLLLHRIIKPRRMHEGYSSHFVCVSVCLCTITNGTAYELLGRSDNYLN